MAQIPIIDFSQCGLNQREQSTEESKVNVGKLLVQAFCKVGFAYLKNTGITKASVDKLNNVTGKFFECAVPEKRKFSEDKKVFGYVGIEEERLNTYQSGGYKEVFNVSGCFLQTKKDSEWPNTLSPNFSSTVKEFMLECKELSLLILEVLALGLELEDKDFFKNCHSLIHKDGNFTALRSLYYPSLPDTLDPDTVRLGEHSDYGTITLLFQDEVGGLEVQNIEGEYVEATPINDTVLINVGDSLQFWTREKLKSAKHRVNIPKDKTKIKSVRRSAAYFVIPNNDVRLDVELKMKGNSETSKSTQGKPVTFLSYLEEKLAKSFKSD